MLSVRVAAALARALPRRAGLVSDLSLLDGLCRCFVFFADTCEVWRVKNTGHGAWRGGVGVGVGGSDQIQ